jgi:hypothetical protein
MGTQMVQDQLHQLTDWGNPPIAQGGVKVPDMSALYAKLSDPTFQQNALSKAGNLQGGGFDLGSTGMSALTALPDFISGVQNISANVQKAKEAERFAKVANVVGQAATTRDYNPKKYVRPEDYLTENPYSQGTGYTGYAANGTMIGGNPTEIQNTYAPGNLYGDLGYEPLNDSNPKQYKKGGKLPKAGVGSSVGSVAGTAFFGPVGGMVGGALGGLIDTAIDGGQQAKIDRFINEGQNSLQQASWQSSLQSGKFNKFMEDGGWVSNDWQPQVITTFGEHKLSDLLQPPHDADMLRAGGHLKNYTPPSARAMFTDKKMAMGGDLQVGDGGYAETISQNPFLPDGGEMVMFRGQSHDDGGIDMQYGENGVEVQGGEPAVKLEDGGQSKDLVVFGGIKINKQLANLIGDEKAEGKKMQTYIGDIGKNDAKQQKTIQKGLDLIEEYDENSVFDQLSMNSGKAMVMGGKAHQKINAEKIKNTAMVQDAIHKTAKQLGVKSDKLAEGKFEQETDPRMMSKNGNQLSKAQNGTWVEDVWVPETGNNLTPVFPKGDVSQQLLNLKSKGKGFTTLKNKGLLDLTNQARAELAGLKTKGKNIPTMKDKSPFDAINQIRLNAIGNYGQVPSDVTSPVVKTPFAEPVSATYPSSVGDLAKTEKPKTDWESFGKIALSQLSPFITPKSKLPLEPSELYPEMLALATNQLQPVPAQQVQFDPLQYAPKTPIQDMLNEVDMQTRAAQRLAGNNPAALAQIAASAAEQKNKIRGEAMRQDLSSVSNITNANKQLKAQTQLQNLQILDDQAVKQAKAISNTKQQAQAAYQSIVNKTIQSKLENQFFAVEQGRNRMRFTDAGNIYNANGPQFFNIPKVGSTTSGQAASNLIDIGGKKYRPIDYDNKTGQPTKFELAAKKGAKVKARNSSIVKALKSL